MPADVRAPRPDAALALFAEEVLGRFELRGFRGWDHAESAVWELEPLNGPTVFLKAHRQPRKFRQELRAYREWLPQLPPIAPKLLGVREDSPYALLLSEVPGTLAEQLDLTGGQELELHRQAGAFLRLFHDLPFHDADELSLADAFQMRLDSWLPRVRGLVSQADIDWVAGGVREILPQIASSSRVPCHRDYTPRNWLVFEEGGDLRLGVIDFEHSQPNLRLVDFERPWAGLWLERPELKEAFFEGYGGSLSADDEAMLERLTALWALTTVGWAHEHCDGAFEQHGRAVLARLKARSS